MDMELEEDAINFSCNEHILRSFRRMEDFRKNSQLCDTVLVVGEKRITAHRLVLAAFSDYFSAMFTGDLAETRETVHLTDLDATAVEALVRYAYTSHIEIRVENVENLLSVACILQIDEVKDACSEFMKHQLHPSNCLGIRAFADGHGCGELFKQADAFTKDRFVEVVRNQEFVLLSPECVMELFASDELNVDSEVQVFDSLLTWVQYDIEGRKQHLAKLLSLVRLCLLPAEFLVDNVEMSPIFQDIARCRELIMEAMKYQLLPKRRFELESPRTRPRKSTVGRLIVVGGKGKYVF